MQDMDHVNWMLSAALGTLARAERMHPLPEVATSRGPARAVLGAARRCA